MPDEQPIRVKPEQFAEELDQRPDVDWHAVKRFFDNCDLSFGCGCNQVKLQKMAQFFNWDPETHGFIWCKLMQAYIWLN